MKHALNPAHSLRLIAARINSTYVCMNVAIVYYILSNRSNTKSGRTVASFLTRINCKKKSTWILPFEQIQRNKRNPYTHTYTKGFSCCILSTILFYSVLTRQRRATTKKCKSLQMTHEKFSWDDFKIFVDSAQVAVSFYRKVSALFRFFSLLRYEL